MAFFPILLILFTLAALASAGRSSSSLSARALSGRFRHLGNMTGKSKADIIKVVGAPSSVSYMGRTQLLQWQVPGYHIALKFDANEMFAGITHEYAARRR